MEGSDTQFPFKLHISNIPFFSYVITIWMQGISFIYILILNHFLVFGIVNV